MLDQLSRQPVLWNGLRWLAEAGFRGEQAVIAQELNPWRDAGRRRFLDFGCGTGAFAPCFPPGSYVGIDLSPTYLAHALRTRQGLFAAASGARIALRSASLDDGLVVGVLHHLPDELVAATMAELHRVLLPGATLLVMEDIPPPGRWNLAGQAMHALDRGGYIRDDAAYQALFAPHFTLRRAYPIRSGICDYGVYVLEST